MPHSLRYAANCSILFTELPPLERPAAAKAAGFDAVEFWWPFDAAVPPDREVDRFVTAVGDAGVVLVALNFAAGDLAAGERGLVSWPARSAEFRDNIDATVGIGARLGARGFNALYGNRIDGVDPAAQDDLAVDNLDRAARAAAAIGAVVLLEPVSGVPRYPLRHARDAVAVADRVRRERGAANVAVLADLYHLAANDDDLDQVVTSYTDRIGHVQIADHPGRHEPGTGRIELDRHLTALQAAGYDGWVACEYAPAGGTVEGLGWLSRRPPATAPREPYPARRAVADHRPR